MTEAEEVLYLKNLLAVTRAQLQNVMSINAELEVVIQGQKAAIESFNKEKEVLMAVNDELKKER